MGLWNDALAAVISLGVLAFFVLLLLFIAGVLPVLDQREQRICASLLALMMLGGAIMGLTDYDIAPRILLAASTWVTVAWSVRRFGKDSPDDELPP